MNNRRRALMAPGLRMVAKSEETRPAQRCASSAMTRSKLGTRPSRNALAICGDDRHPGGVGGGLSGEGKSGVRKKLPSS